MTMYVPGFGLGSINYWDGSWDNDADEIPYQSREVFENRDGMLEILLPGHRPDVLQKDRHHWRPDRIETRFIGVGHSVWLETKAIHEDVAVDKIRVSGNGLRAQQATIRHSISVEDGLAVSEAPKGVHLFAERGRYAGIHRYIGFAGNGKIQLREDGAAICLEFTVDVIPDKHREFAYVVACGEDAVEARQRYENALNDPQRVINGARQRWEQYFERHVPSFDCDNELYKKLYYFVFYVLRSNLYDFKKGAIQHPYSCPSKWRLLPSWSWDFTMHSAGEKWLRDYPAPVSTFRNHFGRQQENGYLPMTLDHRGDTWKALDSIKEACQPYFTANALWDHYLIHNNRETLRECLGPLVEYDRYLAKEREVDGLFVPRNGGELTDNSSRLVLDPGKRDEIDVLSLQLQPIDWNVLHYTNQRTTARMARELGFDAIEAEMTERADSKARVLKQLWNEKIGLYADRILPGRHLSHKRIPESLLVMLGDFATKEQIASSLAFLQNPQELWTRFPVPSLPQSDPAFCADDVYASYWNGRVWPPFNWCYIEGLMHSGQKTVARELLHRTLEMFVVEGEPHCMENFHPFEGPSYSPPHSTFNQSWCATVADLLLRRVVGLQINAPAARVSVSPVGVPGVKECKVERVPCGSQGQTLSVNVDLSTQDKAVIEVHSHLQLVNNSEHWIKL